MKKRYYYYFAFFNLLGILFCSSMVLGWVSGTNLVTNFTAIITILSMTLLLGRITGVLLWEISIESIWVRPYRTQRILQVGIVALIILASYFTYQTLLHNPGRINYIISLLIGGLTLVTILRWTKYVRKAPIMTSPNSLNIGFLLIFALILSLLTILGLLYLDHATTWSLGAFIFLNLVIFAFNIAAIYYALHSFLRLFPKLRRKKSILLSIPFAMTMLYIFFDVMLYGIMKQHLDDLVRAFQHVSLDQLAQMIMAIGFGWQDILIVTAIIVIILFSSNRLYKLAHGKWPQYVFSPILLFLSLMFLINMERQFEFFKVRNESAHVWVNQIDAIPFQLDQYVSRHENPIENNNNILFAKVRPKVTTAKQIKQIVDDFTAPQNIASPLPHIFIFVAESFRKTLISPTITPNLLNLNFP